MLLLNIELILY